MRTKIQKWGNSLAVRLPKSMADEVAFHDESPVDLTVVGNAIVLKPAKPFYRLDDLLAGITPENLHEEQDFGRPVGKEEW
jgi:antitoxin MazE